MLACVTRGSATPGVRARSGRVMNVPLASGATVDGTLLVDGARAAVVDVALGGCVGGGCDVGAMLALGAAVVATGALVEVAFADTPLPEGDPLQPPAPTTMSAARMPPPTTCFAAVATGQRY